MITEGEIYGRLTVIGFSHKEGRRTYYNCRCICGKEKVIREDSLKSGSTKSCGCLKKETSSLNAKNIKYLGLNNRKHYGCINCESDKHYAKGYCKNCYNKMRYHKWDMIKLL